MMFRHFDKDKTGRLDLNAFKSCLRALGYDLPMVEQDEPEPEFEQILLVVDPNKDGFVTLQDYMAFMISKETADYCIAKMKPYVDSHTGQGVTGALDYMEFT